MGKILKKIKASRKWQLLVLFLFLIIGLSVFGYFKVNPVLPQLAIHFLNEVYLPQSEDVVLVFAPHPDDETIACGGYINESIKNGAEVYIVLVTDGNRHNLKAERYQEFQNATKVLGVSKENLIYLNYQDSKVNEVNSEELKEVLLKQIEKIQPNVLFYPHPDDSHKDHSIIGKVIEEILKDKKTQSDLKESLQEYEDLIKEEKWEELERIKEFTQKLYSYKYLVHHEDFPQPKKYAPDLFILPPLNLITIDGGWEKFMLSPEIKENKEKVLRIYQSQFKNPFIKSLLESSIRENELFAVE